MKKLIDGLDRATGKLRMLVAPTSPQLPARVAILVWTLEDYASWLTERLKEGVSDGPGKAELTGLIWAMLRSIDSLSGEIAAAARASSNARLRAASTAARVALLDLRHALPMPDPHPKGCVLDRESF